MYMVGGFIALAITGKIFHRVYTVTLRTATGWEDSETPEFQ